MSESAFTKAWWLLKHAKIAIRSLQNADHLTDAEKLQEWEKIGLFVSLQTSALFVDVCFNNPEAHKELEAFGHIIATPDEGEATKCFPGSTRLGLSSKVTILDKPL